MPQLSVIIPTYNNAEYISEAINSVLSQTYKDYEIIVVDDGSTDNTKETLKKYYSKIRYFYQENKGVSAARNMGINNARGEFIAILDSDDIWLPEKIEFQMQEMLKSELTGIVSCSAYFINAKGEIINELIKHNYSYKRNFLHELVVNNVVGGGSCALIRKECFKTVGLFDEDLYSAEDWDFWLKISRLYDIRFIEKCLVKVMMRADSMSAPVNIERMLLNELKMLNAIFQNDFKEISIFLKKKAYSSRYFCASRSFCEIGLMNKARYYILKSILLFPFKIYSFGNSRFTFFIKIFLGNKVFNLLSLAKKCFKKVARR